MNRILSCAPIRALFLAAWVSLCPALCPVQFSTEAFGQPVDPQADQKTDPKIDQVFDSLYGEQVRKVKATPSRKDDVALAGEIILLVKETTDTPALMARFAEEAYKLAATSPAGYDVAADALELWATLGSKGQAAIFNKLVLLRMRQYKLARSADKATIGDKLIDAHLANADALRQGEDIGAAVRQLRSALQVAASVKSERRNSIKASYDATRALEQAVRRIGSLKQRAKNKDAAAAQELIELYVVQFDHPEKAQAFAAFATDEQWKTNIALAVKPLDQLTEPETLKLGNWYRGLGKKSSAKARPGMLKRAHGYFGRYLELHPTKDLHRTKVSILLKSISAQLRQAGIEPTKLAESVKATAHWAMADDMDVYQNGKPLRDYTPDFRTRDDEAERRYSASIELRPGDVFTIGGRRGGAFGGTLAIVGQDKTLLWYSNTKDFRVYEPDDKEKWYLPEVALRSKQGQVTTHQDPYALQADIVKENDGKPQSIWGDPDQEIAFMVGVYKKSKAGAKITKSSSSSASRTGEAKAGKVIDLLAMVRFPRDTVSGKWTRDEKNLYADADRTGASAFAFPVEAVGDYEMKLSFTRTEGDDTVGVYLPVYGSYCVMEFSAWRGAAHGIAINKKSAKDDNNPTRVIPGALDNQTRYSAWIKVQRVGEQVRIQVKLDDQPLIDWTGSPKQLGPNTHRLKNPRRPGLFVASSKVTFHSVTIRPFFTKKRKK